MSIRGLLATSNFLVAFPLFGSTLVTIGDKQFGLYSMSDAIESETIIKTYGDEKKDDQYGPFDPTKYISNFYTLRIVIILGYILIIVATILFDFNPSSVYLGLIITGVINLITAILLITGIDKTDKKITYSVWLYLQIILGFLMIAAGSAIKLKLINIEHEREKKFTPGSFLDSVLKSIKLILI